MNSVSKRKQAGVRLLLAPFAIGLALALAHPSFAIEPKAQQTERERCSALDIEVLTLTEKAGENGTLAGKDVLGLQMMVLKARDLCAENRCAEGIALYQAIIKLYF